MSLAPMQLRLLVTRPREQALAWVQMLREAGVDAHGLALIEIEAAPKPAALEQAWRQLSGCALAIFVSANAAKHFFDARPPGAAWPAQTLAGSTGGGTSAALRRLGVPASLIVGPAPGQAQESESLWLQLQHRQWKGQRVVVIRGEEGREWLAQRLSQAGATVDFLAAYRRLPPRLQAAEQALLDEALRRPSAHAWLFSSSQAVAHLRPLLPAGYGIDCAGALCTHERIAQAARDAGFERTPLVTAGADGAGSDSVNAASIAQAMAFLQSAPS